MGADTTVAIGPNGEKDYKKLYADAQGRLYVRVDPSTPIPTTEVSAPGFFKENTAATPSTPGIYQTLLSGVVPAGKLWKATRAMVSSNVDGVFHLKIDGTIVGTARTSAETSNAVIEWLPARSASAGQTLTLDYRANGGTPVVDVWGQFMGYEITI